MDFYEAYDDCDVAFYKAKEQLNRSAFKAAISARCYLDNLDDNEHYGMTLEARLNQLRAGVDDFRGSYSAYERAYEVWREAKDTVDSPR